MGWAGGCRVSIGVESSWSAGNAEAEIDSENFAVPTEVPLEMIHPTKETVMSNTNGTQTATEAVNFDAFDVDDVEVLETADGTALPEMGASSGSIGTSSSSSSTCSAC